MTTMKRWKDLSASEKAQVTEYIVNKWRNRKIVRLPTIYGGTRVLRTTYRSIQRDLQSELGVAVSYNTVWRIIRWHFEKPEPKIFIPDALQA